MPLITGRDNVLKVYERASKNKWVIPCFCTENLTTTEAILSAAKEYGESRGIDGVPVIIAITNQYDHRAQSTYYTHTRKWDIGLKLFLEDIKVLTDRNSPYADVQVLVHLDHTQYDTDAPLLSWDMRQFSSIMYDASKLPFSENIKHTGQFVKEHGKEIVIEGACDEIVDATGNAISELTTVEAAEAYFSQTGADLIVANLGTEHRASNKSLKYYGDRARAIKEKIGHRIVLHGTSSVSSEQLINLFDDGVCKVNIWTALERDTSPVLLEKMVENASLIAGKDMVEKLRNRGLLGPECRPEGKPSIQYFTTYYRQNIIFEAMKEMIISYFKLWYR